MSESRLIYLLKSVNTLSCFLCKDSEIYFHLDNDAEIISQGFDSGNLIMQGLKESRNLGLTFKYYLKTNEIIYKKKGLINPINLKK